MNFYAIDSNKSILMSNMNNMNNISNTDTKDSMLIRNYCSDTVLMYKDVYNALSDGFDEFQTDCGVGVPKSKMMSYIMSKTKGSVSPYKLDEILSEFEKGK